MSGLDDFLVPGGAMSGRLFARVVSRAAEHETLAPGSRVGPFRVVRELGRGGMATVYLAVRDDGTVTQQVALKILPDHAGGHRLESMFARERQWLVDLDHPHIARFVDAGTGDDGRQWLAMEWIDGQTLAERLETSPPTPSEILGWMHALCAAVGHAHRHLVIHRDLKPGNVMIRIDGILKLLDFGIATGSAEPNPVQARSPRWASPEQERGDRVGPASDIFQLGRILESCITPMPGSPMHRGLAAIARHAMAPDPANRYASCAEFAADLTALASHHPMRCDPPGWLGRTGLFLRRNPWSSAAACGTILLLATTSALFLRQLAHERDAARQEAERANAATRFLTDMFVVADPGNARGNTLTANQILERGSTRLASELRDQPEVRARLLGSVASVHMGLGQLERAEPMAREAVAVAMTSQLAAPDVAALERGLAQVLWRRGDFPAALETARTARMRLDATKDARLWVQLGNTATVCLLMLGRTSEALAEQQASLAAARHHLGNEDPLVGMGLNNLARIQSGSGQHAEALATLREARARLAATLGPDHPDTLDLAISEVRQMGLIGQAEAGLARLDGLEPLVVRVIGTTQHRYGYLLLARSELLAHAGRAKEALPVAERAVARYQDTLGNNHLLTAEALAHLASVERSMGRDADARARLESVLETRSRLLAPTHPDTRKVRDALAGILCRLGEHAAGRSMLAGIPQAPGTDTPDPGRVAAESACGQAPGSSEPLRSPP